MAQVEEVKNETKVEVKQVPKIEIETGCFVCHGTGHWAREVKNVIYYLRFIIFIVHFFAFNLFN